MIAASTAKVGSEIIDDLEDDSASGRCIPALRRGKGR
jgi:hypothetical protein